MAYVDKHHYYRFNNQTYGTWFGQSAVSLTGKHVREVLGEAAYEAVRPHMEQALSGQRVNFESQIPYHEGEVRYIKADYVPHINSLGEVEGYFSLVSDISDRKRAEIALRQSEEQARLAIQVGRLGTWRYNFHTDLVELDNRMREIWGEPNEEEPIPLLRVMERIHPDDRDRVAMAIGAALDPNSSGTYEIDYRIVWDDGTERWVSANGQVYFDGEGESRQPISFLGTALDITDRKQVEAVLRQSEERFRTLANAMPQIVWTTNANGVLDYVSQRWFDDTGLTLEQTQDQVQYVQVIHPDDVTQLYERWSEALECGSLYQAEVRIKRASDGIYRWFLTRAVPIKTEQGRIIAWYGTSTDIDDRKQIEIALAAQEQRYRHIFEMVDVSIWEEDFSEVKAAIDHLKTTGVRDFRQYFIDHPEFVQQAVGMVHVRDVNQASLQLFGAQTKAELLNSLHQIFMPETHEVFIEELLTVAAEETYFTAETTLQNLQGEQLQVWFSITFPSSSDAYDRVLVSLLDITERKHVEDERKYAEAALKATERRLQLALEVAQMIAWDINLRTNYAVCSENAKELWGANTGTAEKFFARVHPDDLANVLQISEQAMRGEVPYILEYRIFSAKGDRCFGERAINNNQTLLMMYWNLLGAQAVNFKRRIHGCSPSAPKWRSEPASFGLRMATNRYWWIGGN